MAVVRYKVVPVLLFDVIRESENGDEQVILPVARCPSQAVAKAIAWALVHDERDADDDDDIMDPVFEEKH